MSSVCYKIQILRVQAMGQTHFSQCDVSPILRECVTVRFAPSYLFALTL